MVRMEIWEGGGEVQYEEQFQGQGQSLAAGTTGYLQTALEARQGLVC